MDQRENQRENRLGICYDTPLIVEISGVHRKSKNHFADEIGSIFLIFTKIWIIYRFTIVPISKSYRLMLSSFTSIHPTMKKKTLHKKIGGLEGMKKGKTKFLSPLIFWTTTQRHTCGDDNDTLADDDTHDKYNT